MTVTEEDSAIPKVEETSEVKPEHCDIVKALEATEHLTNPEREVCMSRLCRSLI